MCSRPRRSQGLAGPFQVRQGGCVVDVDALPLGSGGVRRQAVDRDPALGPDQAGDVGVPHRLEGVDAKNALGHRAPLDVMDAAPGAAADLGIRRQERQRLFPAGGKQRPQLGPHVAPQGRVGLFIDVRDLLFHRAADDAFHNGPRLAGGQVPGLGVDHEHLGPRRIGRGKLRVGHHAGGGAAARQLDARVQRAGEIIRNDQ